MSRDAFALWGVELDDIVFAQALAAWGVLAAQSALPTPAPLVPELTAALQAGQRGDTIPLSLQPEPPTEPAAAFAAAWQAAIRQAHAIVRLAIRTPLGMPRVAGAWLVEQLSRPEVGAASVFLQVDEPRVAVAWNWPIRLGLLSDPRSGAMRLALRDSRWSTLFRLVDVESTEGECDLLLLASNVRSALASILQRPGRLAADCVLVLGGFKVEAWRAESLVQALRTEVGTAGVAVLFVPRGRRPVWFDHFIVELSHNSPIDVALRTAATRSMLQAPFLAASPALVANARLDRYVERLGRHLKALGGHGVELPQPSRVADRLGISPPPGPEGSPTRDLGEELATNAFGYLHETGDATRVAEATRELEAQTRGPVRLAMADGGGEPRERPEPDPRHLQARFRVGDANGPVAARALGLGTLYLVAVWIGLPQADAAVAPTPFPSHLLPASVVGWTLTIVFHELGGLGPVPRPQPRRAEVHLPPDGDSQPCLFPVRTASQPGDFKARLIVLHEGRVLQTALLRARVVEQPAAQAEDTIALETEVLVRPGFHDLESRATFDAALVVNHDEQETSGVVAATDAAVAFFEPVGVDKSLRAIQQIVSQLTDLKASPASLRDPDMLKILRSLAEHGRIIRDCLPAAVGDRLARARAIQVVEAREGAFLPVEFFYERPAPSAGADLCDHGLQALREGRGDSPCSTDDESVICPTAFWGFNRVIERRPHGPVKNGEFQLSEPTTARGQLSLFRQALLGASEKVKDADIQGPKGAEPTLQAATGGRLTRVRTWREWRQAVQADSPSLLVLLPHSLNHPEDANMAALEIGADLLKSAHLEKPYVCGPACQVGPVVLLLGCSTELTDIAYQSFVGRFKAKGAALVLGTLATIRGRHAVPFLRELVAALQAAAQREGATFGSALLEVKQRMLARGNPFVLALAAYGDAGWRL